MRASASDRGTGRVVALVQRPPPVTGLSLVNQKAVEAMAGAGLLQGVFDLSPTPAAGWRKMVDRALRTLRACGALAVARRRGAEVVYMPLDGGAGLGLNLILMLAARLLSYRVWVHHHSFAYIHRRSGLLALILGLAPRGMGHVALCEDMLEALKARYPAEWARRGHRGRVVSNAFVIDPSVPRAEPPGVLTIGHLSNLTEDKGAVRFIEIFRALRGRGVAVRARLAGPIGDARTQAAVDAALIDHPDAFAWVGPLYGADKTAFYRQIDAFLFPSRYANEAQPLVLLEALAAGAAVLVTARGCMACDHATSPGLVADDAGFDAAAAEWLERHASADSRRDLSPGAQAAFSAFRTDSDGMLAGLLAELGSA